MPVLYGIRRIDASIQPYGSQSTGAKMQCLACSTFNPPGFKFCGQCGSKLEDASPAPRPDAGAPRAERRHIAVLFCDLVGSTALSEQLDPEDLRNVLRTYQETCGAVIERFGGHVAQYLGDGLLVYFGFPRAHENDARRAVHAGLGIVEAIARLNEEQRLGRGLRLSTRVGIHAGPVVTGEVGSGGRREHLALGQVPNVAARLQGMAGNGEVLLSSDIYDLVRGFFDVRYLGAKSIRGLSQPLDVYQVMGESATRSWFEAIATKGLSPLVGRERELAVLLEGFEKTAAGEGRVTLLDGEAGVGKSRLIHQLKDRLGSAPARWLTSQCSPHHSSTALHPLSELFKDLLGVRPKTAPHESLSRIERRLKPLGSPPAEVVPFLAALLSIPLEGRYPPPNVSPQLQKQRTFDILLEVLFDAARRQPVILAIEDLHWVDPSTLEFLKLAAERVAAVRLFVVLSFRPGFAPPFDGEGVIRVSLRPLGKGQAERLARCVAGGKALPEEILRQLVEKTDGVPLFVEELTKTVLESGLLYEGDESWELAGPLPSLAIPATLQGSLMARLDRLPGAKIVAQLGAVLGRDFSFARIQALSGLEEEPLLGELSRLVDAEILYQQGTPPRSRYIFKHALIQEVAYDALLKSSRQEYHRQVARILESDADETADVSPEILAHHFTLGGLAETAVGYWQMAGDHAAARWANQEAAEHLRRGLRVLEDLPASADRDVRELTLRLKLGAAHMTGKGYGAPEVASAYGRAYELSETLGDALQLFQVLQGLWMFYVMRGSYDKALGLGRRLLRLAESAEDPALLVQACHSVGFTHFSLGDLEAAQQTFERGIAAVAESPRSISGDDIRIHLLAQLALTLWHRGYPELALERSREALRLAREDTHPFGLAYALTMGAWLYQIRDERKLARDMARQAVDVSEKRGFGWWQALGSFLLGWAADLESGGQGRDESGLDRMRKSLDAYSAAGVGNGRSYLLLLMAEAHGRRRQLAKSREYLEEGLRTTAGHGERIWESEFYRLKADLLLSEGDGNAPAAANAAAAEQWYLRALATARRRGATSLELRSAVSLGRLWRELDRGDEAKELVAGVRGHYPQGAETAELRRARELVEQLS